MSKIKIERVGDESYTRYGTKAVIVEYRSNKDVIVEFQDEYKYRYSVTYLHFKKGNLFNPFDKSVYGIGYFGSGKYSTLKENKEFCRYYSIWRKIFDRCYTTHRNNKNKSYEGCTICEKWHCFQNFADWYDNNKYETNGEILCVDKDILFHGNKIYSPETCLLVPKRINSLFEKSYAIRGDLPIGVTRYWYNESRYLASMKVGNNKSTRLGVFDTIEDAFQSYKNGKEKYIKEVANTYKSIIPQKIYDVLINYEVLLTD